MEKFKYFKLKKRWNILKEGNTAAIDKLSKELTIDRALANILVQRGIDSFDRAKTFFRPELANLHDPYMMKDMDRALERINKAINCNEKILIYGDYDVDGTTAVAVVFSFFMSLYKNLDYYIPDRYNEGYGVSKASIDFAFKNNFTLIIALDCGIKEGEKIKYAKEKGIDFIVCDHHLPSDELPEAYAILNPKRKGCQYPYKELSGCGVGFKLIHAYAIKNGIPFEEIEVFLDLVAVSIASDVVPVTGENRLIVYYGLKKINSKPRACLEALLTFSSFTRTEEVLTTKVTETLPKTESMGFGAENKDSRENVFKKEITINDLAFSNRTEN